MSNPLFSCAELRHYLAAGLFFVTGAVNANALPDFTELVTENGAAVVNISTVQKESNRRFEMPEGMELPDNTPFGDLFKKFFGEGGRRGAPAPGGRDAKSLGSGFILSDDGYVITNNHVVKDAEEVIVRLSDRREFSAKIVGVDARSDIAVLKIEADNLPVIKIGSSEALKVGEWVLAIGSPFGFDHSVTAGIVSAKGRSLPRENYVPFIQTDVAINPGNSGGPLFNLDGEVVGVNSQIYSRTGGFMGLSFAIPIDVAMNVVEQIKTNGHVTRGWLGVLIQDVTRELAESFGMKQPHGALIAKVLPDSPASKAGIKVGDIIVHFNGKEVGKSSSLPPMVGAAGIQKQIPTKVIRNGKEKTLLVTIGELPDQDDPKLIIGKQEAESSNRLAVKVTELTKKISERLDIGSEGVVVTNVASGPARRAGIQKGDVIVSLAGTRIKGVDQFMETVKRLPAEKPIAVLVHRSSGPIFLALKVPE